ncbi:uncharacterized protein FOMMEDRAFT_19512 [Fomitiporia mediterranea MF3/22]|uniref:uncharacterized protein n=1 Tax=Fomitiporia mediterranea (strain MF3/22) TaxID=694068 RepID=UPI00044084E8|nr:uncharacterized protein FOMMEDRAFT_19512 [Fomitiporia mediterranea MF3/22]EJD04251.1 hypothetical protein FOMMEDRAFT_19512 [Fomitiporia mediterranea MF3/22]
MLARRTVCAGILCLTSLAASATQTFLEQGFQFDYTPSGAPVPIPTTAQCDSIPLSWSRAAFTTGPNPQAPYYIQVYTSTFLFPSIVNVGSGLQFDWPVPYVPGTQYQICMFDSNGVSGGCQRMDTVIPAENSSLSNPPICTNLTYPAGILDVEGKDHTGTLSQYGWVDQCTDISIQPKNGTPPFTLTVAPALHPPWNITSNDMSPINWTVQLSWGSPFFISLVDASGQTWANGPLHSGGQGSTGCLALGADASSGISDSVAIGSGIGGLIGGLAIGGLAAWFILRRRHSPYHDSYMTDRIHSGYGKDGGQVMDGSLYTAVPSATHAAIPTDHTVDSRTSAGTATASSHRHLLPGSGYEIEPFTLPESSTEGLIPKSPATGGTSSADIPLSPMSRHNPSSSQNHSPQRSLSSGRAATTGGQVYVVHHDGGRAPVTVYTSEGAEVIELPPRYNPDDPPIEQRRRAGSAPRKTPRSPGLSSSNG